MGRLKMKDFIFEVLSEVFVALGIKDTIGVIIFFFLILLIFYIIVHFIKTKVWDEPQEKVRYLEYDLEKARKEKNELIKSAKDVPQKINKVLAVNAELRRKNTKLNAVVDELIESEGTLLQISEELNEQLTESEKNRILSIQKELNEFLEASKSNLTAIPYMSRIMADYETYGIEILTQQLDWGDSQERKKKVKSLVELRKETKEMLEKYKEAEYQLAYLIELYPALQDIIDCEFNQLPITDFTKISDYDKTRDFLSKEEYQSLSISERNQLALDRYKNSQNKSKWQIGRDYELYVGYKYSLKGYSIDYTGSYMKLEDLGRDLIAKKDDSTLIIQCKYWSSSKLIHEKHVTQLYGTTVCYCFENNLSLEKVRGILITNITLSDTAKKMADYLGIQYAENYEKHDFPCIKCNIGHDTDGSKTKIYHLPFDQQYDTTKIDEPGEFYAMTVKEAEDAGFRRAFKWHSQ